MAMAFLAAPSLATPRPATVGSLEAVPRQTAHTSSRRTGEGFALVAGLAAIGLGRKRNAGTRRRAEDDDEDDGEDVRTSYNTEDWVKRVKMIEGDRAVFDVTIPKPLGIVPRDFPLRPGVGIAKINAGGNTDLLNEKVILNGGEGMWVLEGDEVVAVNGTTVEGQSLEEVKPLVKNAEGDSITLTLCRAYLASPVKVVFLPSGKVCTMKRGTEISKAAEVGVEDVAYSCQEGWCKACWQTDPMHGVVFRACNAYSKKKPPPKNPRTIPQQWNSVVPLWLLNQREAFKLARARKKEREAKQKAFKEKQAAATA